MRRLKTLILPARSERVLAMSRIDGVLTLITVKDRELNLIDWRKQSPKTNSHDRREN